MVEYVINRQVHANLVGAPGFNPHLQTVRNGNMQSAEDR